jgi:hypothetical protein
VTPAELRAWVAETRRRQGLGPTISHADVLAKVAALVADTIILARREGGDDRARTT